jgi:3-methylcrotonyl-CoA carboxylase alpha subunit
MLRWSTQRLVGGNHHSGRTTCTTALLRHFSSFSDRPFDKVLVANRGEIACRVIRTCQTLGIPTVAIYSVADGPNALHAQMADEAYSIGHGPHPTESYLLQDQILEIAQTTQAQAVHPGYGFLSENAGFCQRVLDTPGMTFVGPPPHAMEAMGSKSHAKAIMEDAQVPTTPGYYGDDTQEPEFLLEEAKKIGFPLLIKAVMGGGGKGMRLVWDALEFLDKLQACQRESVASFGDDRVLLEKYLQKPRHVEVQVVADAHGNVVHLYERDCSLQRRHQKIIEEAPASDLPQELRQRLGEMGKRAAQAAGYVNAGTVEFLLDTQDPGKFYFCEMNTRLQVEHPITELITGIDLVEWQLRIAAGEELPIPNQADIPCHGHAFEARVYAENPARNFLPATGMVWHHQPPAISNTGTNAEGVRVDTGIQTGQEVSVYYDPMICKLIVHDENRDKALQKLQRSLKGYQIAGVPTNIDFLVNCAQHETFQRAGAVNTGFLDDHFDEVQVTEETAASPLATAVGVFASLLHMEGRVGVPNLPEERRKRSPWSSLSGSWRLGSKPAKRVLQLDNGTEIECTSHRDGSFDIQVGDDETFHVNGTFSSRSVGAGGDMQVVVNGTQRISMTTAFQESSSQEGGQFEVRMWPKNLDKDFFWEINVFNPMTPSSHVSAALSGGGHGTIKAPMPGKISRINFAIGDSVEEGDVLLVMEAMKMEHTIEAPASGVLTDLKYHVGDVVQDGTILATVETTDSTDGNDESKAV